MGAFFTCNLRLPGLCFKGALVFTNLVKIKRYSPLFSFDAPSPLFYEIIRLHGVWSGDKPAVIFQETHLSWRGFIEQTQTFAGALLNAGLSKGDRVVVVMDNRPETAIALFGIMAAGCASVPINLTVNDAAVLSMIKDASAAAIICTESEQARLASIEPELPETVSAIVTTATSHGRWHTWRDFLTTADESVDLPEIEDGDIMNIIYSSGTTGQPKGIVHTHRGRRDWAYDLSLALRYHHGSRCLLTIGLYSNISWVAMLCTLLNGGTLVIQRSFEAEAALDAIEKEAITHLAMVPIQFQRLLEAQVLKPRNLTSMSAMMSCGSPLSPTLKQQIFNILPCGVIELYGLTEGIITTLQPEDAHSRWSSVGKPLLGTDIRIIDDNAQEVAEGETGEIVSRGRITMPGYLNREQATTDAIWTDEQGRAWLRSGDIGKMDQDRFLYIVDRKKDMILSGGQNVYPQDIEAVLTSHPEVDEVAVIGASSARWGETPVALVVPRTDLANADEIQHYCNTRVGRQQRVAEVIFLDALPRNPNGKLLKRDLRDAYRHLSYQ